MSENFKETNRHKANQTLEILNLIGCGVREIKDRKLALMKFYNSEIEMMAEREHARRVVERLSVGWKYAVENNQIKKLSPYLMDFLLLPEEIQNYSRDIVRNIPEYLAGVGLEVYLS